MTAPSRQIDVRGPRFAAWVTAVVLAAGLLTANGWVVAAQAAVFAVGALAGLRYAPYGVVFRVLVAPRLGPVREREPEAPPRFAQLVGLVFAAAGALGYLLDAPLAGAIATGLALVAACSTRPPASASAASSTCSSVGRAPPAPPDRTQPTTGRNTPHEPQRRARHHRVGPGAPR
ncbi:MULTISPECIES: DUF4395 domain-containing protein [unclassified Blastococcus]